jgi:hypothetical protein
MADHFTGSAELESRMDSGRRLRCETLADGSASSLVGGFETWNG